MASFQEIPTGWRASVYVKGERDTKQFRTKREAIAWSSGRETELRAQVKLKPAERNTFQSAVEKYELEVLPKHKAGVREGYMLRAIAKQLPSHKPIGAITTTVLAEWRDARLKKVKGATVLREIKMLNTFFETARKEWQWIEANPLTEATRPRGSLHRTRTIKRHEIRKMLAEMPPKIRCLFLVALRTGMRAGELCNLTWDRVYPKYCHVIAKGIGEVTRDVPTNWKTRRLLAKMRGQHKELVFNVKASTLTRTFMRYRERAGLSGFTFHDSRHTAATWMAKKVDVLTLCKIFGWANPKMAMTYYNPTADDIADQLD